MKILRRSLCLSLSVALAKSLNDWRLCKYMNNIHDLKFISEKLGLRLRIEEKKPVQK